MTHLKKKQLYFLCCALNVKGSYFSHYFSLISINLSLVVNHSVKCSFSLRLLAKIRNIQLCVK